MPKICTISIVSHNSYDVLPRCLDSIKKHIPLEFFDIVVIDNDSDDDIETWKKNYSFVQFERFPKNCGFSKAHNYAFKKSKKKYFLALNPDTEFLDQDILKLFRVLEKQTDIGILAPKMKDPKREYPSFIYREPNLFTLVLRRAPIFLNSFPLFRYLLKRYNYYDKDLRLALEVDWCSGAFMLLKKEIMQGENLFDEDYFLYFEDTDTCRRIRIKGYKIYYYPNFSYLHHWERKSLSENNLKKHLINSMFTYFNKWGWKLF